MVVVRSKMVNKKVINLVKVRKVKVASKDKVKMVKVNKTDKVKVRVKINKMVKDKVVVVTGSGGGSFYVVFSHYHTDKLAGFYDFAHNDSVQIGAETGVVGLLLCGTVVLGALWQALLAMRKRHDPLMRGTAFGVAMAICWLLIHSAVDFNAQMPANALMIAVVLALAWVASSLHHESAPTTRRSQAPGHARAAPAQGQPSSVRP